MTPDRFYALIAQARGGDDPALPSADPERLHAVLNPLPTEEVVAFASEFEAQLVRLNRWSVWGAGYVLASGMSDDGFRYFRSWLIGKGRAAVDQALTDPEGLGPWVADEEEFDNEGLEYVTFEILDARGFEGEEPDEDAPNPEDDPEGEPFDEEAVAALYPRLAALAPE